jgi:AcrR family transcriptional regulator
LGYGDGGNSALQPSVAGRRGSAAETRHAVIAAARDLFLTHGYGAITIDQITAKPA